MAHLKSVYTIDTYQELEDAILEVQELIDDVIDMTTFEVDPTGYASILKAYDDLAKAKLRFQALKED